MATTNNTNSTREAIFNRLDDLFVTTDSGTATGDWATDPTNESIGEAKGIAGNVSDKEYRRLTGKCNCTSFSKLEQLHECPRKYELDELRAAAQGVNVSGVGIDGQTNVDFAYGHSVGAGIQCYAATKDLVSAQFAAFLAWRAPYDAVKVDKSDKETGDKSIHWALYAVEKFQTFWHQTLQDFDLLMLPEELGHRPAVEVSFGVDTQNGYYHFGHIDAILINKHTQRLAVWEGKTTARAVKDAMYGNSYQALGYSVVVDAIAQQYHLPVSDYEVFYIVYNSKEKEFELLPFTKSVAQRAEWLQDLLLDHAMISKYRELSFFPKRGSACINKFGRQCDWYGTCQMKNSSLFPKHEPQELPTIGSLKALDFKFTLDELVSAQKTRA